MSGMDPIAALAAGAVAQARAAFQEAALTLGAAAEQLLEQVTIGEILTATILPAENGVDRIAVLGQTLPAQLPPGIHPGEALQLQVTGVRGTQILVRNLGIVEPPPARSPSPQASSAQLPSAQPPSAQPPSAQPPSAQPPSPHITARTTPPPADPIARPREVFIAPVQRPVDVARPEDAPIPPVQQIAIEPDEAPVQARIAFSHLAAPAVPPSAEPPVPQRLVVPPPLVARDVLPGEPQTPMAPRADGPVAILSRLRVPVSAMTLAAARLVSQAAEQLPRAYAKLDALLARMPAGDARVATLRAVLGFAGRIDLSNVRALPEQIASFVTNVVAGPEAKLAQIARALAPDAPETAAPQQPAPAAQAQAVERAAAIAHDVKTALFALIQSPPAGAPPQLAQALGEALTATTAVQLNVLQTQTHDPTAITIPLPATFYEGGRPSHLRIARDKRDANGKLDADNFSIAFVLDTATLGTVAIDLKTVGRAVSVSVKTERPSAADRFRSTFHDLRDRFALLRYRIAAIDAAVAPRAAVGVPPATTVAPDRISNLDMRA